MFNKEIEEYNKILDFIKLKMSSITGVTKINNMETNKQITINIPDGYIIDEEKSVLKEGNIVFKKKEVILPKTWEEYWQTNMYTNWTFGNNIEYRYISLRKLEILRDIYRQGWKPDWTDKKEKYTIYNWMNRIEFQKESFEVRFLSFQSAEIRDEFLKNFKDLIEECKDFI